MSVKVEEKPRGRGQPKREPYGKLTVSASHRAIKTLDAICAAENKKRTRAVEDAIYAYAAERGITVGE